MEAPAAAPPSGPRIVLQVVCSFSLGGSIDLRKVKGALPGCDYKGPGKSAAAVMSLANPLSVALVFPSGRVTITEAVSIEAARMAAQRYVQLMQAKGLQVKFQDFYVQSITSTFDAGCAINLEHLSCKHWQHSRYEPSLYPAVAFTLPGTTMQAHIFSSGRIVVKDARTEGDVRRAYELLTSMVAEFRER